MADVHGRLTGSAGVCLATLGPGATNLLTGIADAHLDKSPLVAITGQGGLERLHQESHQAIDIVDMFAPVTKWNTQLNDADIVHESVRKAFKLAEYEKPGATHLELPEDVASEETPKRPLETRGRNQGPRPNRSDLDRIASLARKADRPLIIAGNGAVRTHASMELRQFVESTDIPVMSTYMGKGAVSDEDSRSLMTLDSGDQGEASTVIERADLVITVGYDIAEHDPADWKQQTDTPIVHIDSQPAEVYEAYNPTVEAVADIGLTLRGLVEREIGITEQGWYSEHRERILEAVEHDPSGQPFTVGEVIPILRDAMAPGDVLISDVGRHKMVIARNFPTYEPNTCIISNGLASMGIAVPGGIAADLAIDEKVVAATGDGGFLMNGAEIETATRLGCGYTIIVFNDNDYGLISETQRDHRGEAFGTQLTNPNFVELAGSFGIDGYRPETVPELESAVETVGDYRMTLVEIPVARRKAPVS
jgi:acetolactate synthase-1/2/3 large subunit